MVCDTCQHDNQPNAKFCAECGAPLARPCPSCGRQQSSTAKFCDECGTTLTAAPPSNPTPAPSAARKRVTALFADLVGSTAFAEGLDPEAVRAGLTPYFELLQSTIDDHAGTVVKFLGDGVFALFGVPEVAEDDAIRAVTAGVDLQRRFRSFADGIRGRHGVDLGLRVGVNTGELVFGAADVDLVGDVLNTAARLEAACEPGHVLVGEDTWRLTRSSVSYEVLGDVRVKGKAEPVATFQVIDRGAGGVDELTPFVGRSSELDSLRAVFDDAVGGSVARLATVIGDPGVGKTRLAQELRGGNEARSFDLRLERRGSTTFAPIADLLREVTGSGSVEGVDRLIDGHPEASRLGPVLCSFLGHGEQRTTEESFWAVRRLLELLAADGPVIVVVDDIQWAEPLFWDLLDHLVEWTAAPVLLIALARPELRELRPELTQPGRRVSATIALEGLDPDTTLELAARLLGIDELPPELAERLPESTEGNPLFVRELVQMLVDDGVLVRDGDRWRLTIDTDAIEVPPTILSLLASRVERLPDDERQVVELASVIGTEFDRGTLAAVATGDVATRLGAVVDRLRRKDLIEPTGQWAGDHPVYRFHHVLIRDAAYRRLLKGHRAQLHERVGRHVDTTGLADDERDVIVAHHFEQVHRYRTELGALDDRTSDLAVEAANRLRSTAERALGREDLASAGGAAIRALELLGANAGTERDELLLIGCEALLSSADVARGARLVDELQTRSADARLAAWSSCFRAQLWSLTATDRLTEASELAADAADRLRDLGDDAGVAKARLVRAGCLARLGRVGDCEAELDLALGAARAAGDRRRTVAVLGVAPLAALWGPSPVARAGGRCLDVLRLLRITTASPTVEATSIRCQGMLEALRGREDAARAKFEASRTMARELGLRHALYETELFAGFAALLVSDAAAAEPHLRAARDGLGRLGIGADAGHAAALLARSLLLQGRVAESDELASGALASAGQNLQTAMSSRAALAEIRAHQGRHDDARRLISEAIAIAERTDATLDRALTELAAARVAAATGDWATASRHRAKAADLLTAKGVTLPLDDQPSNAPAEHQPLLARDEASQPVEQRIWNPVLEIVHSPAPPQGRAIQNRAYRLASGIDDDHWIARNWDALTSFDPARYEELLAADFRSVDHRPVALGVVGRDEFLEWLRATPPEASWSIPTIHRLSERGMVIEHAESWADGAGDTLMLIVIEFGDGFAKRMDAYEVGDLDAALARYDEITGALAELDAFVAQRSGQTLTNSAWRSVQHASAMWDRRDRDGFAGFLTDDFVATTYEPIMAAIDDSLGTYDKERYLDVMFDPLVFGPANTNELDLIAVRGEELCLFRTRTTTPEGDVHERIVTAEVRDGRCVRVDVFPHDRLSVAQIALDRRSLASLGFAEDHPWYAVIDWFYESDTARIASELPDRYRFVDHRRITYPDGDRSQLINNMDTQLSAANLVVPRFLRITDRISLIDHYEQPAGGWERPGGLMLSRLGPDGRVEHLEFFDVDDEASAIAAFDRLLAEERASQAGLGPLTNAAWEIVRAGPTLDGANGSHELIAVRSDRYCLTRFAATDPDVQTVLVVSEIVDGRVERSTSFRADDLAAALIELDAWYLSEIDELEIHDWMIRLAEAFGHGTREDFRSLVTDDFESFDERRLGLGHRTADGWAASYVPLVGLQHPVVTRVVRHDGPIWLSEYWVRLGVDGSEWHSLLLIERDGHRIRRSHEFDLDQAELAFARYEELLAAQATELSVPDLTNRACEIAAAFAAAYAVGDRTVLDRLVDPDGDVESRGELNTFGTVTGRAFLDFQLAVRPGADEGQRDVEVVAVRDEHHCLVRVDLWLNGDLVRLPIVVETDDERIKHMVWFDDDQLIDAQLELDRRWFESIGYADHWFEPIRLTLYDPHPDALFEHLAPDFEYIDHRPLMFPSGDAELLRSTIHSLQYEVVFTIPRNHRMSDAGSVFERIETALGEIGRTHVVFVTQFVDQRVQRIEAFDINQLDQALARYDELTHG